MCKVHKVRAFEEMSDLMSVSVLATVTHDRCYANNIKEISNCILTFIIFVFYFSLLLKCVARHTLIWPLYALASPILIFLSKIFSHCPF